MARWPWRGLESELGAGEEERQRGRVKASAAASADVGGRVGEGAGRLRCTAASMAHGRHAAGVLCSGRDAARRVSERASTEAGQARRWAGLGQGEACGVGWEACWAGFGHGPRNEAAAREMRKAFFNLYF